MTVGERQITARVKAREYQNRGRKNKVFDAAFHHTVFPPPASDS
jgi:hypothetical protein